MKAGDKVTHNTTPELGEGEIIRVRDGEKKEGEPIVKWANVKWPEPNPQTISKIEDLTPAG